MNTPDPHTRIVSLSGRAAARALREVESRLPPGEAAGPAIEDIVRPMDTAMLVGLDGQDRPIGYVVYTFGPGAIELRRVAVVPSVRRRGLGCALVRRITESRGLRRTELWAQLPERATAAQCFLRACGLQVPTILLGDRLRPSPAAILSVEGHSFYLFRRRLGQKPGGRRARSAAVLSRPA